MKVRYVVNLEIILAGGTLQEIEDKFFDLDLGKLEEEKTTGNITHWDYRDTEVRNKVDKTGFLGEEI